MPLMVDRAVFFHIPKTGGSWVRSVLRKLGLPCRDLICARCANARTDNNPIDWCCNHAHPGGLAPCDIDHTSLYRFTFVRDPLRIYQSLWSFKMKKGWKTELAFDRELGSTDFHEFVSNVLRHYGERGGWVSTMFERFVGPIDRPLVDFVGRQENLRLDLLWALRNAGIAFDASLILSEPPVNEAAILPEWEERCRYTPALRAAVSKAESRAIARFGYFESSNPGPFPHQVLGFPG